MKFNEIIRLIEENDSIVIYRHINPDYDAYGSQLGLKHLIMDNYPTKKVYTYGLESLDNPDYLEPMDNPSLDIIEKSLVILVDTSRINRSDDMSFLKGKTILKIDHHLKSEHVSDYEYVDIDANSVSIIIASLAKETGLYVSKTAATYMFGGILTDTCKLAIDKVDSQTFEVCSFLASKGINIPNIHRSVFDINIHSFKARVYFENKVIFNRDLAYFIAIKEEQKQFDISPGETKDFVDLMSNIREVNKYAIFAQMEDGNYTASLRSHTASIVEVAQKYGGGGHRLACGIPSISEKEVNDIIELLSNI